MAGNETLAWVQREREAAWRDGFEAGLSHGRALERHDPQWDRDGPPERPENPYTVATKENT